MKKLLVLILVMIMLCGCSKKEEIDMTDEVIKYVDIYYHVNGDLEQVYDVRIQLNADDVGVTYIEYSSGEKDRFEIYDVNSIITFIKDNVPKENIQRNKEKVNEDEQFILWSIIVKTEKNTFEFTDSDKYPTYWEDLWTMLVEATAAESISDFGFETE